MHGSTWSQAYSVAFRPSITTLPKSVYARPFVPISRWLLRLVTPSICEPIYSTRTPFAYSYSTAKWSKTLPYSGAIRTSLPPIPTHCTGGPPKAQFITSRLCTCISTIKSPLSHVKNSHRRSCHSISDQAGSRCFCPQVNIPPPSLTHWPPTSSPIAPSWMAFIPSTKCDIRRICVPATMVRPFLSASSDDAITERIPTGSTPAGFSINTCLPASIAAFR